jgi:YcaO-like protein with predicted kinase domain
VLVRGAPFVKLLQRGQRTQKLIREGVPRCQPVEHTIAQVLRLARIMGITRVGNVTGLDSVGIPVVMVCRPNSRSVAVSQGKGLDLASARASGLMEAAELYHAETITLPLRLASCEELRYQHDLVVDGLPQMSPSRFHPNLRLLWCESLNLLKGEVVLVPYELVHTNYTLPLPDGYGCFLSSSNGLASGNELVEAISHAICEVVERDATTLWRLSSDSQIDEHRVDISTINDRSCLRILEKFGRAGLTVVVWDITSDIGLPTFACLIAPAENCEIWHSSVAMGYGCHPARDVALLRALTEAAQVRLTIISGVRDDVTDECYAQLLNTNVITAVQQRLGMSMGRRKMSDIPNWETDTFEEDVEIELQCLKQVGVEHVLAIDLSKPEFGIPVVKVIIPGLESSLRQGSLVGPRGKAAMRRQK